MSMRQLFYRLFMLYPGEGRTVIYLYALAGLIGIGMSVGQTSSDALFFKLYGVDYLPYMFALIAITLIPVSLLYAAFVDRLMPHRMLAHMLFCFGAVVMLAWMLMQSAMSHTGIALYFIAYGVISELLLTHFYFYTVSFFDAQQAKRLMPSILAVSLLGRALGGVFVGAVGSIITIQHSALVWAACVGGALGMVAWRHRGEPSCNSLRAGRATKPSQMVREGIMFARQSRLVRVSALSLLLLVMLLCVQEFLVGKIFVQFYPDEKKLAAFFGWFSASLNVSVLVVQLLLSGRMIRYFGLKTMNLVYPVSTLFTFGMLALSASYFSGVLGRINTRGMLPGFRNSVAGLFLQALPSYMQGRIGALMTGLVLPVGLLGAALFLWLVPKNSPLEWIAMAGFVLSLVLCWLKFKKNEAYADSLVELVGDSVFSGDVAIVGSLGGIDKTTAHRLADYLLTAQTPSNMNSVADMIETLTKEYAGVAMLHVYPVLEPKFQTLLLPRIARLTPPGWENVVFHASQKGDAHQVEETMRFLLAEKYPPVLAQAEECLKTAAPRLRASIAAACLYADIQPLQAKSRAVLEELLDSLDPEDNLSALGSLEALPYRDLVPRVHGMLHSKNDRARAMALNVWSVYPQTTVEEAVEIIESAMADTSYRVRTAALTAAARLPQTGMPVMDWLSLALRDTDYRVREAGAAGAKAFMPDSEAAWTKTLTQCEGNFDLLTVLISRLAASGIQNKVGILHRELERHLQRAGEKLLILQELSSKGMLVAPTQRLFGLVLQEDVQRHLDTVLHVLGCLDTGKRMSYIRAGLASRNRHLWAKAMESALQIKSENQVFRKLAILYEAVREGRELGGDLPGEEHTLHGWLRWCQRYGSTWLADCAGYSLAEDGGTA